MKLKFILILFIGLLALGNTAKARDEEKNKLLVDLYMTILYGQTSMVGDKFKSIQGDLVRTDNGKSFYNVKDIDSKVIKEQFILDKGNNNRSYMAIIKKEYDVAMIMYAFNWQKKSGVKNTIEDLDNGDTIYTLKDNSGAVFKIMTYKDTNKDIVLSAYPL